MGKRIRWSRNEVLVRVLVVMSEDGGLVVGVLSKDLSWVVVCEFGESLRLLKVRMMIIKYMEEVMGMGFLFERGGLVMVGRDGYVRVMDLYSGRMLKRIEIGVRVVCDIL